jgi:hypothetical protein
MKRLTRPEMTKRFEQGDVAVETKEADLFIAHCNNIGRILAHSGLTVENKIARYIAITGAETHEV